jgi:drug/metabolite transporter (DMT)-like permease
MLGESLALGAALVWSTSIILFKRSEAIRPLGMNLFKNVVGTALLGLTLLVMGRGLDMERPAGEWLRLAASGVLGIAIADTLIFMALRRLGPALLAIVDCVYAPTIVLVSVLFLGERIGLRFALGAALVVGGVLLATVEKARPGAPGSAPVPAEGSRLTGVLLGLTGIGSMALGVALAKPPLQRGSLPEVTMVRLVAATAVQLAWVAIVPSERSVLRVFAPSPAWRTLIPAAVLASYVSLLLWLGGFKWADASVAAVLNQMSSVFTIALARIVLGEPVTRRRALGGAVAVGGALVVLVR